jgi:hypothetical protein
MPAVNLNKLPAGANFDQPTQQAFFKLWLILTTNKFLVHPETTICQTTGDASQFETLQKDKPAPFYYIDLEALSKSLAPIPLAQVQNAFALLKPLASGGKLEDLNAAYYDFWKLGTQINNYGTVYCVSIPEIVGT